MMISDLDIYRAANLVIEAARRWTACLNSAIPKAARYGQRIRRASEVL